MLERRVIETSKLKMAFVVSGAIAFVLLGVWILSLDVQDIEDNRKYNSPVFVYGIGAFCTAFFSLCAIFGIKKLFDKSPGLIISTEGILDNFSSISQKIIPWTEIVEIGEYKVQRQKFISIKLKDPEKYIDNRNVFKRMLNSSNMKLCGTPISISASNLKIGYDDLIDLIQEYYCKSRDSA